MSLLKDKEIVDFFREHAPQAEIVLNHFTPVQTKDPRDMQQKSLKKRDAQLDADIWRNNYVMILNAFPGLNINPFQIHQFNHHEAVDFNNPEIYNDMGVKVNLLALMKKLLNSCGVDDFCMADVNFPKRKRTIRFCSAIVQFWAHCRSLKGNFDQICEEQRKALVAAERVRDENVTMHDRLEALEASLAMKRPQAEQERKEEAALNRELETKQRVADGTKESIERKRENLGNTRKELESLERTLKATKDYENKLERQIVRSPDRLTATQNEYRRRLQLLLKQTEEAQRRLAELKENSNVMMLLAFCEEAVRLVTQIGDELQRIQNSSVELERLDSNFSDRTEAVRDLCIRSDTKKSSLSYNQDKLRKLKLQREAKIQSLATEHARMLEKLQIVTAELSSVDHPDVVALVQLIQQTRSQTEEIRNQGTLHADSQLRAYSELMEAFGEYSSFIQNELSRLEDVSKQTTNIPHPVTMETDE